MREFTYTKTITSQQIDDIMTSALESGNGISYWCDEVKIHRRIGGLDFASEHISAGGELKLHDSEEEAWHTLNRAKFLQGLSLYDGPIEDFDAAIADEIVQFALFGKVIYG